MKRLIMTVLALTLTSSFAMAGTCVVRWNDSGNWVHQQPASSFSACMGVAYSIGNDHCTQVANGAPAEDPNGVTLTVGFTDPRTESDQPSTSFYYSCH